MAKKPKMLVDELRSPHWIRAWKEGRTEIAVQVWKNKTLPEGDPDGDWAMPAVLGIDTAIKVAVAQTK